MLGRKGGRRAHKLGKAHQFTPEEAREAGKKGAAATHKRKENNE
jgi:general stress protein YciG